MILQSEHLKSIDSVRKLTLIKFNILDASNICLMFNCSRNCKNKSKFRLMKIYVFQFDC